MGYHNVELDPKFVGMRSAIGPGHSTFIPASRGDIDKVRFSRYSQPRHRWTLINELDQADALALFEFIRCRRGAAHSFKIKDPIDFTTATDHKSAPGSTDVDIGTGDGVQTEFALSKVYADGTSYEFRRYLRKPVEGTVSVAQDGITATEGTDYSVDYQSGRVSFYTAPSSLVVVTAGCEFRAQVRFNHAADRGLKVTFPEFRSANYSFGLVEDKTAAVDGDRITALTETIPYGGGGTYAATSSPVAVDWRGGRFQMFAPSSAVVLRLPDLSSGLFSSGAVSTGGPYFVIFNAGSAAITLHEFRSATWQTIVSEPTVSANKAKECWVDSNGQWRAR